MSTASRWRTEAQQKRIDSAVSVGYEHARDSDYSYKTGEHGYGRKPIYRAGCLSILFGDVVGHKRAMVVYPDGSVETKEINKRKPSLVQYSRPKLGEALRTCGVLAMRDQGGLWRRV